MSVRIKATAHLPEMFADVVGYASESDPTVLLVKKGENTFTVHDDEIVEFFYA